MKDARLAELEFLADLERSNQNIRAHLGMASGTYGLSPIAFKQMLYQLVVEECVNGSANVLQNRGTVHERNFAVAQPYASSDTTRTLNDIYTESEALFCLNHKGRLRLWRLRDELRRSRLREDFGILWAKQHWLPDLSVGLAMRGLGERISVLRIDLDNFKAVNDKLGHAEGDRVLKRAMEIVRDTVSAVDGAEAYRVGGDEFAAVFPKADHAQVGAVAESIREQVEREFGAVALDAKPTASIGVLTFTGASTAEDADHGADQLAIEAKRGGKNRVVRRET